MNERLKRISIPRLILSCVIPLAVGAISALITRDSFSVYKMLERPPLAPPAFIFPIVWTLLYIIMGAASYFAATSQAPESGSGISLYVLQLILNFFWPIIFFNKGAFLFALFELALMIVVLSSCIYAFFKSDRLAGYLMLPVLVWSFFAFYLNIGFLIFNR